RGSLSRICRTPKVLIPKYSEVRGVGVFPFMFAGARTSRSVISRRTARRGDTEGDIAWRPHAVEWLTRRSETKCTANPAKKANLGSRFVRFVWLVTYVCSK